MKNVYDITNEFEKRLSEYTGAPYVVTVDNQSNALFLSLMYEKVCGTEITIPSRTYPSVPCEIIHAGGKVKFRQVKGKTLKGAYQLEPTNVWDSALSFTANMYKPGTHMCVSFTGPYKHFKLSIESSIVGVCSLVHTPQALHISRNACLRLRMILIYLSVLPQA